MEQFIKLKDLQGADCFVNVKQIRAIQASLASHYGGSNIIFDGGSCMEVQESPERVICRCQNSGAARQTESAY